MRRNYTVYFITIIMHELTHWLCFKLEADSPKNPYPGKPEREEKLELELLGGMRASYHFRSHGDEYKIDGIVLLLSERDQKQSLWESPRIILTQKYCDLFFEDIEQLLTEVQKMRLDIGSTDGVPTGASHLLQN